MYYIIVVCDVLVKREDTLRDSACQVEITDANNERAKIRQVGFLYGVSIIRVLQEQPVYVSGYYSMLLFVN